MKNRQIALFLVVLLLLTSCVSTKRAVVKPGYDFGKISTIGIGKFSPSDSSNASGETVRNEFARQLLSAGYNVKWSDTEGDVVVEGSVNQYIPEKKYLFYKPKSADKTIVVSPTEVTGVNGYSVGKAYGMGENAEIVVTNAMVGLNVRIVDPKTREVVWTNSYTYEGFDIQTAIESNVYYMVKSFTGLR
ncbi:MAG: hypothetical protein A2252_01340 [Elusimicrobia bacterium RIFOXYA2_FULL_39_19]|nr:MAG: hypothetical protein A2252_01340 [Elusimicrobia bacterium RIFOXYA2_FULL_39_19]